MTVMTFITRGGEGLEDENEDRKATRSGGRGLEESASRSLMLQGGGGECGGRGYHSPLTRDAAFQEDMMHEGRQRRVVE